MNQRQKQTIMAALVAMLGIVLILIVVWFVGREYSFRTYANEAHSFTIGYPAKWDVQEIDAGTVGFLTPVQNDLDTFRENVTVIVQDVGSLPSNLMAYSDYYIGEMQDVFKDNFILMESGPATLGGKPAYKIVHLGKGDETDIKFMTAWTIQDMKIYQIMYTSVASQYDQYLLNVKRMFSSFRFK